MDFWKNWINVWLTVLLFVKYGISYFDRRGFGNLKKIFVSFLYKKNQNEKGKVKKESLSDNTEYALLYLGGLVAMGLLVFNCLYTLEEKIKFDMMSPLGFSESFQLFITTYAAAVIAFMQFKVQRKLDSRNEQEQEERVKYYVDRLRASRIADVDFFDYFEIECINFHLDEGLISNRRIYNYLHGKYGFLGGYVIHIMGKERYQNQIYPTFLNLQKNGIEVSVKDIGQKEVSTDIAGSTDIYIYFEKNTNELLNKFYYSPAVCNVEDALVSLKMELKFSGEDAVYREWENSDEDKKDKKEDRNMLLSYQLTFEIVAAGGYSDKGTFRCSMKNMHIKNTNLSINKKEDCGESAYGTEQKD